MASQTASSQQPPQQQPQSPAPTQTQQPLVGGAPSGVPFASVSLYVGDLLPDVSETQLYEVFKAIGPVSSIRICRDAITRRSLCYGYVNFHNPQDARVALETLNYRELKGKPMRIMYSQRDPSLRKQGLGNIFIKNLDASVDNKALYDTFSAFGNILSCKVMSDRGFAFVHYETEEAANKAIDTVNGKLLAGKKCFVAKFVPAKERSKELATKAPKWTNIFVKNMPKNMTEERFREIFGKFGTITSLILKVKKNEAKGGEEKAFGFANYASHEEAAKAVEAMNNKEIDGTEVYVGKAQKKSEREQDLKNMFEKLKRERISKYQGVNLFVKNLDEAIDDEKLRQEFQTYGTITSAKVMRDEKAGSKGFGFVCFATPDEATKAVTEMNGKMLLSKPIFVGVAERKEQRRAKLEHQFQQRAMALRMQPPGAVPGAPVYPQPMYYGRGGFMYPTMMPRGGRFPARGGFAGAQPMPYLVAPGGVQPNPRVPGGRGAGRGGRGGALPGAAQQPTPQGAPQMALKYNPNVRNPQQPAGASVVAPPTQPAPATPADPKQVVGERIYHQIVDVLNPQQKALAGKITGMILESLQVNELVSLAENQQALNQKISEALEVLESKK